MDLGYCLYREEGDEAASSYVVKGVGKGSRTIVSNTLPEMTVSEVVNVTDKLMVNSIARWYHFEVRSTEACSEMRSRKGLYTHPF